MEAQQWIDNKAKGVSQESRVESMSSDAIKAEFERVLKAEHLADASSAFGDPEFFDEVPLYSRYQQVEFLERHGDVNSLLMELALDYLDRVRSQVKLPSKRLIAVSVLRDSEDDYIVPYIFVCNRDVKARLGGRFLLEPSSALGKQIEALVKQAKPGASYNVFEDVRTVPNDVRVFVSYKSPSSELEDIETFSTGRQAHRHVG